MTFRTTWEDPDPNEHYTRPCSRCERLACLGLIYTQGPDYDEDICWRCAGRYPVGCDCEQYAQEDADALGRLAGWVWEIDWRGEPDAEKS